MSQQLDDFNNAIFAYQKANINLNAAMAKVLAFNA